MSTGDRLQSLAELVISQALDLEDPQDYDHELLCATRLQALATYALMAKLDDAIEALRPEGRADKVRERIRILHDLPTLALRGELQRREMSRIRKDSNT